MFFCQVCTRADTIGSDNNDQSIADYSTVLTVLLALMELCRGVTDVQSPIQSLSFRSFVGLLQVVFLIHSL